MAIGIASSSSFLGVITAYEKIINIPEPKWSFLRHSSANIMQGVTNLSGNSADQVA